MATDVVVVMWAYELCADCIFVKQLDKCFAIRVKRWPPVDIL